MTDAEAKQYHGIITDSWALLKKYSTTSPDQKFWDMLILESNQIYLKHNKSEFASDMLIAVGNEVERIHNRRK